MLFTNELIPSSSADQRITDEAGQVSTSEWLGTDQQPGSAKRRQSSKSLKRQIVAEALAAEDVAEGGTGSIEVVLASGARVWLQARKCCGVALPVSSSR
jgi:hypothetical protein